jgi:hypothetical protein
MPNVNAADSDSLFNRLRRTSWIPLCFLAAIFIVFVLLSPSFHDQYFGVAKYEWTAVRSLRSVSELERSYVIEHPDKGFACQLNQLQPSVDKSVISGDRMDLLKGEWSGYKFEISGCTKENDGIFSHYQVTAVPVTPGGTGVRAFCIDESGRVFYDLNGSAIQCLAAKQPLP